jgi:hypothetical protein
MGYLYGLAPRLRLGTRSRGRTRRGHRDPSLVAALSAAGASDIRFKLELNVPFGNQAYLLDALEFGTGENQCEYQEARGDNPRQVHLVYLLPSDKTVQPSYVEGLERGAKHLQVWWKNTLGSVRLVWHAVGHGEEDLPG